MGGYAKAKVVFTCGVVEGIMWMEGRGGREGDFLYPRF